MVGDEPIPEGPDEKHDSDDHAHLFMNMYPYWLLVPAGLDIYPAACASGLGGMGADADWSCGLLPNCRR